MVNEMISEFNNHVIPFWKNLYDPEFGGFYGYMDYDLNLDKKAVKGCILNSRIMWFFSNSYMYLKDEDSLRYAEYAFDFMNKYCIDKENGGVYWSMTYDGTVFDSTKHTYNQAFAIYALTAFYEASGNKKALDMAYDIYNIVESKCRDEDGYLEAFDRTFSPVSNEKLSENGVEAKRTMNTALHILEAYTEFYKVTKDEDVKKKLYEIYDIFKNKIYIPEKERLGVFFDNDYNNIIDLYSYGHDIEASWLLDRGLEVLDDAELNASIAPIDKELRENILKIAFDGKSVPAECENGVVLETRIWWVQAESIVGFVNGYQKDNDPKFMEAAEKIWDYIKMYFVDSRPGSEWFQDLDINNNPVKEKPILEEWKCPYHTGRMCIEMIKRGFIDV